MLREFAFGQCLGGAMRVAAIGTNSVRLLVAEAADDGRLADPTAG